MASPQTHSSFIFIVFSHALCIRCLNFEAKKLCLDLPKPNQYYWVRSCIVQPSLSRSFLLANTISYCTFCTTRGRKKSFALNPTNCPRPWALGPWALGLGPWSLAIRHWALGTGYGALGLGPWALGLGPWALGSEPWALGIGPWALGHAESS